MKVQELIDKLSEMNPKAEVMIIQPDDPDDKGYLIVEDCEEEFSYLVTIGTSYQPDY